MKTTTTPSAQYSITMRVEYPHGSGWIAKVSSVIGEKKGVISAIDFVRVQSDMSLRDYSIECSSIEHAQKIIDQVKSIEGVTVHSVSDDTFLMHLGGKIEIRSKVPLKTRADLSMAYTPGVARVCSAIHDDYRSSFNLTIRKNCIAVVTDGSAVLGLGNIGPAAAMPVMEGKAVLFKEFAGVDAFPLCVGTQDAGEIIQFCRHIAPTFGGINLEDISAPRCFHIEEALQRELDIPVFHDDQHGTAVVVLAGLLNALKITKGKLDDIKVVISGAGAAGIACGKMLQDFGSRNLIICDSKGAIHRDSEVGTNVAKQWAATSTNPDGEKGSLKSVIRGADVFLGLSAPDVLAREDVEKMRKDPIIFAMANPVPEVSPEDVGDIVAVMATGRSDYPNQINNVLAFPGIFRGALDARASQINASMKRAAAEAIAAVIDGDELSSEYIIPSVFNPKVAKDVAAAVARAAHKTRVARRLRKTSLYRL
ncbi:MAG: malate oxidoreductase [Gammaproteobacteria bacterium]|nr:MAG: malate oxidoreductase [Gammaproteobacteria bacterium]